MDIKGTWNRNRVVPLLLTAALTAITVLHADTLIRSVEEWMLESEAIVVGTASTVSKVREESDGKLLASGTLQFEDIIKGKFPASRRSLKFRWQGDKIERPRPPFTVGVPSVFFLRQEEGWWFVDHIEPPTETANIRHTLKYAKKFKDVRLIVERQRERLQRIPHYAGHAPALNPDGSVSLIVYVTKLEPGKSLAPKTIEGIPVVVIQRFGLKR